MRVWRFIMIVLGVMIVTGALGGAVGGLIAYAMPDTTDALLNARPDRWVHPPELSPDNSEAASSKSQIPNPKSEIPSPRPPMIPVDERIARGAALAGALALLLGGCLGLLLAILDQFIVFSRNAMTMIAAGPGSGVRRAGLAGTSTFTPPPPINI